ncbi:Bax inhibitor-1/YccA family protein [Jatrophihabitans telluris]|uniref:Bax inhibitor-1/YccA family protein n=1 Tax=Jatrophihabitans telluris TaxID=2038343 RepID=A0ABY4R292_9ACTN|nr:Bax inhibitor-1/YccA family protein [Jatrophihabitans telluris]UQX89442.1 Bax inhibitor-1/YccA family protein [Jatrophihabitans telluris]
MASNPVLRNFEKSGQPGVNARPAGPIAPPPPSADQLDQWYAQPAYGQQPPSGLAPAAPARYLTLDDVITRCVILFATVFAAAAVAWFSPSSLQGLFVLVGIFGGLGLGLYISITGKANAINCSIYAALEGLFLGGVSAFFNDRWPGIVVQAVTGTILVAGGTLIVYKTGAVRVTPRFTKIVFAATLGAVGLMLVNGLASIFVSGGLGLRDGQNHLGLAIGFSLLCIVIAASNLIVDFDTVEQSVRRGVDEKYGWYLSFGILVTLVWLYLEILRMLSYLRNN